MSWNSNLPSATFPGSIPGMESGIGEMGSIELTDTEKSGGGGGVRRCCGHSNQATTVMMAMKASNIAIFFSEFSAARVLSVCIRQ